MLARALRLWRTVRWLKPIQVFARLWHLVYVPKVSNSELPQCFEIATSNVRGRWVLPARRRVSMLADSEFRFLNETRALDACGWDDAAISKLWRYNLHYFDDLNAFNAADRGDWHQQLIKRWIVENPAFDGAGWEPYPTSLRIVNWVKWALATDVEPPDGFNDSLALQARWLRKRLEH
ncbi:MAG: heparinase, partial [Pseudomonadota bacterium]|nr:heparinase [Pseudomonadota bacterium]